MDLFYREQGTGTPIIILHGFLGSCDNWLTLGKRFAEAHKVYLVDQRNHGRSGHADAFDYDILAEDLKAFMALHAIEKPVIIGHSMGGKTAMQFAMKYPDQLEKLIVVDIAPKQYKPHHQTILKGLNSIDLQTLKSRGEADKLLSGYIPELPVRQFLLKNLYRNDEGGFSWRMNLPVLTEKVGNVVAVTDTGQTVNLPTLFIRGGNSNYILDTDFALIQRLFAQATLTTIDGAGHWVHAEKPNEFVEAVNQFV
ncbi:alpha/beta fold hydrolase [Rapidithrix thailandica]|uniref:Alpha/beta fold hydrolase n=1 Tax=Rapidithrix thailandica TaxID=413964 RepID=A0AAW9S012_9BACT